MSIDYQKLFSKTFDPELVSVIKSQRNSHIRNLFKKYIDNFTVPFPRNIRFCDMEEILAQLPANGVLVENIPLIVSVKQLLTSIKSDPHSSQEDVGEIRIYINIDTLIEAVTQYFKCGKSRLPREIIKTIVHVTLTELSDQLELVTTHIRATLLDRTTPRYSEEKYETIH